MTPVPTPALPMNLSDLLGYAAASLTTASFVPQVLHTWKTRHTAGLSLGMVGLFALGVALWLAYGISLGAWPVIVANTITLVLAIFLLGMKLRF